MTLSLQEISDRIEIAETVNRYSYGLDQRIWSEWDLAFLPDAIVDFSFWGMAPCSPQELRAIFSANDAARISGQHLLSNQVIWLDGDTARTHTEFNLSTLARSDRDGFARRNRGGGSYEDQLVRTEAGWRIKHHRGTGKWALQDEIPWSSPA
jgi:SnoaL-like domain